MSGTPFIRYIESTNETYALAANGLPVATIENNPTVFPLQNTGNASLDIFNLSTIVSTDRAFLCADEAVAYAAAVTDTFPVVYYWNNNRTYQVIRT